MCTRTSTVLACEQQAKLHVSLSQGWKSQQQRNEQDVTVFSQHNRHQHTTTTQPPSSCCVAKERRPKVLATNILEKLDEVVWKGIVQWLPHPVELKNLQSTFEPSCSEGAQGWAAAAQRQGFKNLSIPTLSTECRAPRQYVAFLQYLDNQAKVWTLWIECLFIHSIHSHECWHCSLSLMASEWGMDTQGRMWGA